MKNMIQPPGGHLAPAAPAPGPVPGRSFDISMLMQYVHIVVRRIWLLAICFVISLVVTLVSLMRQVPVFSCYAQLLLQQPTGSIPGNLQQQEVQFWGDYVFTQQHIIESRTIRNRTVERMTRPAGEVSANIISMSVNQLWKGSILSIYVESLDPVIGAEYCNAIVDEYLNFRAEQRTDSSQSTVMSLSMQANRLLEQIREAEERLVAFERNNNIIAITEMGNIAAHNLASLAGRAASFKTERMLLEYQQPFFADAPDETILATLLPRRAGGFDVVEPGLAMVGKEAQGHGQVDQRVAGMIERGVIQQQDWVTLNRRQAALETELKQLRKEFKDKHPKVQQLLRELQAIERGLQVELQFALHDYKTRLEALSIQEEASRRAELEWEDEALDINRKSHEFSNLERQVDRLRNLYELIFNRLKEIDLAVGIESETVQVLERAIPAGAPTTPRKVQGLFMGGLVGIAIGLGLVLGLEFLDDSLRYPEEVTRGLGLPFLGVIPAANWDPEDLRTHMLSNIDQKSGLAEAYRNVRSALLFSGTADEMRTIVVTSAVPLEGKTTTCLNLAVSLAQAGSRVLLVDGDLRRGSLHKFFGLEGGRGLSDVLIGHAKPEAVIQRTGLPNLDLVATGSFPPNPAELILRPERNSFMEYAKRAYDRVLVDCPPVMAVSEAAMLASFVDGVIYVIWAGKTSRKVCQSATQLLRERGANVLGCVLNNLEFARVGYYYYSGYYGYYDYDYGLEPKSAEKV